MNRPSFSRRIEDLRDRLRALGDGDGAAEALDALGADWDGAEAERQRLGDDLDAARRSAETERARYRSLFELAADGSLVTNGTGKIVEANQAAADLLNISRQFLIGKPMVTFLPPEARAAFRSELRRLNEEGRLWRYATRLTPRGMAPIHVELSAAAFPDFEGAPIGLHWTIADVSERVVAWNRIRALNQELERNALERTAQLEDQIRANEQFLIETHAATAASEGARRPFLELVQGLDAVIWKADAATGRFTFVSRHIADLLGFPVARWLDEPDLWAERLHPDDREWVLKNRQRFALEGRDHEAEYRLLAHDGRAVWFRESVRVVDDDAGRPRELRGLMVNISKRKKVERQLHFAKQDLAERLGDLRYLQELGARLSSTLELAPLLAEILDAVLAVLGADRGAIFLYDPARDDLAVAARTGLDDSFAARIGRLPRSSPLVGRFLAVSEPAIVEDVTRLLDHAEYLPFLEANAIRAVANFPLQDGGDSFLGSVAVFFTEPHSPPESQVHLVDAYLRQAADLVANARLRDQLLDASRRREEALAARARALADPIAALCEAVAALGEPRPAAAEALERGTTRLARLVDELIEECRPGRWEAHADGVRAGASGK